MKATSTCLPPQDKSRPNQVYDSTPRLPESSGFLGKSGSGGLNLGTAEPQREQWSMISQGGGREIRENEMHRNAGGGDRLLEHEDVVP